MNCSPSDQRRREPARRGARGVRGLAIGAAVAVMLGTAGLAGAAAPSPLADAAERADQAAMRALLARHAEVNAPQVDGMTALLWAVYHDDLRVTDLLVAAGADVERRNRYGVSPLSLACTNGNSAMVERLLNAGADPDAALPGGETPLMTAARTGTLDAVAALLRRGAKVDGKDDRRGQTALMWAAAEGHVGVVEALLRAGADVHARVPSGFTPLLFAVREGRLAVVRVLLEAGADANETFQTQGTGKLSYGGRLPPAGASALLLAVINAHYELAVELLRAGANPNASLTGYTPLHAITAVRSPGVGDNDPAPEGSGSVSSLEFVKALVAHGADLNARMTKKTNLNNTRLNEIGATPFFLAALTADAELMTTLARLGADPSLSNADNSTPLMAAAGLATRSPGEDAGTESDVLAALQVALDLGADVNAVDSNGETAMHAAAYKNLPQVVKFLAARKARIQIWNQPDKFGWTPLAIAAGYRFGNFKPSPETERAIRDVMIAAGVTPPTTIVATTRQIY